MLDTVPQELKFLPNWVGFKNKVPVNLKTGQAASSADPSTWMNFYTAQNRYKIYGCDGLGFVFQEPFIGIDLDHCIENGKVNDFGKNVVQTLQSYAELSPSGTGLHVICKGTLDKSVKTDIYEVYQTGRYFTMTGNTISNLQIADRTEEIKMLFSIKPNAANKPGWIAKSLEALKPGNLHNESVRIIGKLHQNRWAADDIYTLLKPHIEKVGGDLAALQDRITSISKYPITNSDSILDEVKVQGKESDETYSMSSFLALDDKVTWIVPGIISDKSLGFIAGLPETGKTWICMDLAIECAKGGGYWLGKFPVKDCKVLYIDQERWKGETKRRFAALTKAKALSGDNFKDNLFIKSGTSIRLDLQHSFDAFRREIEKIRPAIVIVDSFATFHTKEENNRKDIQEVLERVKQLRTEFGVGFLFVDHEGKSVFNDEDKTPNMAKMVGSIGKPAAAEYVLTVRKEGEGSMVYHTKSTLCPAVEPFLVKVTDEDEAKTKISVRAY